MNKVSIVIATIKENKKMLDKLIESITQNSNVEIIVVENNFDGTTVPMNKGIRLAYLNDVIIISDDVRINTPDWINIMQKVAYSDNKIGLVTGSTLHGEKNINNYHFQIAGFNPVYIKRELINKIGLLDENIKFYHEEEDYSLRCELAGYKVVFTNKVKVNHCPIECTIKYFDTKFFKERAQKYVDEKWK